MPELIIITSAVVLDLRQRPLPPTRCRTYSTLVSNVRGRSRLQQLVDWLGGPGFDGCLVFDECHKVLRLLPALRTC